MILDRLRGKKKQKQEPSIDRGEFLQIRPVRNPQLEWEETEDKISITIPLQKIEKKTKKKKEEKKHKKRKGLFSGLSPEARSQEKKIQLDVVGSIVWKLCDGKRTNEEIIEYLHTKYKLLPSEAEISLNAYFNELSKRGLLGFILPKEAADRFAQKRKENYEKSTKT